MAAMAAVAPPSLAHFVCDSGVSDFSLRINGVAFPVLSGLMRMRSRALQNLFDTGAVEVERGEWAIDLPHVDAETTKQLLEHCYGDPLVLTAERLQGLWSLSRYLQLDHVPPQLIEEAPGLLPTSAVLLSAGIEARELISAASPAVEIRARDAGRCLELALHAGCGLLRERAAAIAATQLTASELSDLPCAALQAVMCTNQLLHGEDEVLAAVASVLRRDALAAPQREELLSGVRLELLSDDGLLRARELGVDDGLLLTAALVYRQVGDRPRALPPMPAAAVVAALAAAGCAFGLPRRKELRTRVRPGDCRRPDSNWGLAFDIRAKASDCAVSALHCARGDDDPCTVRVFVCDGSYRDHADDPKAWRLVTQKVSPVPLEKREATRVALAEPALIPGGGVRGFLVLSVQFAARMLIAPAAENPAPCRDDFIEVLPGCVHHAPAAEPGTVCVDGAAQCFVGSVEYLALPPAPPRSRLRQMYTPNSPDPHTPEKLFPPTNAGSPDSTVSASDVSNASKPGGAEGVLQ